MKKDNNLCFFSSPGIEANFIFLSCCFSLFKFNLLTNSLKKNVLRCNNVLYVRGVPEDEEEDEEIKEDPADKEDDED